MDQLFFPWISINSFKKTYSQNVFSNSFKLTKITNYFLFLAKGAAGDHYYFLNRTWHGRKQGNIDQTKLLFFLIFFQFQQIERFISVSIYIIKSKI